VNSDKPLTQQESSNIILRIGRVLPQQRASSQINTGEIMSKVQASDKVHRVIARQSTGIMTEGVTYEVLQCEQHEDMWCIVGDPSSRAWLKKRFSDPLNEETPLPEEAPKKLENVFIRVDGEAEKEAAIELLKSIGYNGTYDNYKSPHLSVCMIVGDYQGNISNVSNYCWNNCNYKELKVNKQVIPAQIIPAKVVFTLTKEPTYNVDGKELTRVEVDGIMKALYEEAEKLGELANVKSNKATTLYNLINGE
jgi:hypothetical protein